MFIKRLPIFEYHAPASLFEALDLLAKYEGKAKVLAGGTDLLISMKKRESLPEHLINLKGIMDMKNLCYDEIEGMKIGALVTLAEIERSKMIQDKCCVLWDAVNRMASPQIRTLGTIGGNLCNAMPSADTAPPLIAMGASITIRGLRGQREVLVENFFNGPGESVLKPDEILFQIFIPKQNTKSGGAYLKLMRRRAMDLAQVGVAVWMDLNPAENNICREVKIALGAVARTPIRTPHAEKILINKEITPALAKMAGKAASQEARPRSSIRASREYREAMIVVLTERAIMESYRRALQREPV